MWCIYLLLAVLLTLYLILVVIAYGIKTTVRIDANNLSVCIKVYIFDWIEILCFKAFVCEQRFYFQFNKGDARLLERSGEEDKKKKKKDKKKLNTLSYIYYVVENMPKITLVNPKIEYGIDFEEIKNQAMFDGGVIFAVNGVLQLFAQKLETENLKIQNVCGKSTFRGVYLEGTLKLSLIKIFFYILHIIGQKRRFQKA